MKRFFACAGAVALVAAASAGAADFTDPAGDTYGPDIQAVQVAERPGFLDVHVGFANHTELADGEVVEIDVDTDANSDTGDGGVDVYGVLEADETAGNVVVDNEVLKYDKSVDDYVDTTQGQIAFKDGTATLSLPLGVVGHTVRVSAFSVAAPLPPPEDPNMPPPPPVLPDTDNAPDTGTYSYTLTVTPTLQRSTVTFTPTTPRAGQVFKVRNVSVVLSSGGPFTATPSCTATVAGKKLGATGACAWRLPNGSRGKRLRVAVAATYAGTTFKLPARSFVVR